MSKISISPSRRITRHHYLRTLCEYLMMEGHGTTCKPKLFAVPIMVLAIDSSFKCLRCPSFALIFATSYTCLRLMVPVTSWPGRPVPFSIPAVFFKRYVVGGVLVINEKVRSGSTVIKVGVGTPGSMWAVRALNSLQKSIDFTPRAPSAGPTGGVGAALPAGTKMRYNLFITKDGKMFQEVSTCHQLSFCLQSLGHCQ